MHSMMHASKKKGTPKSSARAKTSGRRVRFPGLMTAARELGVERSHLYRVLSGQRESRRLMRQYRAWQSRRKEAQ